MSLRYLSPDAQLLPSEVGTHTQFLTHGPPFASRHRKAVSLAHPPTRPVPQTSPPGSLHRIPLAHARSPGLPEQHAPPQLSHTCLTQCRITENTPRFYSTSKSVSLVLRLKNQRPRQPRGFGQPRADRPLGSRSSLLTGTPQWVPLQGPRHRTPLSALSRMSCGGLQKTPPLRALWGWSYRTRDKMPKHFQDIFLQNTMWSWGTLLILLETWDGARAGVPHSRSLWTQDKLKQERWKCFLPLISPLLWSLVLCSLVPSRFKPRYLNSISSILTPKP